MLESYPREERVRLLCSKLGDEAFDFIQNRPDGVLRDFVQIVEALKRQYSPELSANKARQLFYTRRQAASESLEQFEGDLRRLSRIAYPHVGDDEREGMILEQVLANTTNEKVAWHFAVRPPSSMGEVLETAKMLNAMSLRLETRAPASKPSPPPMGLKEPKASSFAKPEASRAIKAEPAHVWTRPVAANSTTRAMAGVSYPPQDSGVDTARSRSQVVCYGCGQVGHFKRRCPHLNA